MTSELSLIRTRDGSYSVFSRRFNDSYHSLHGAIQESKHVFIENGLAYFAEQSNDIHLLELGFGTGLNFLLSYLYLRNLPEKKLIYESWEAYPLPQEILQKLNYTEELGCHDLSIHEISWNNTHCMSPNISLNKKFQHFEELDERERFNLIFHDAFAPQKQPYLWEEKFLEKLAQAAQRDAILVTYCSQGAFRRALHNVGFAVEKLPGPPGKREMVRAVKR